MVVPSAVNNGAGDGFPSAVDEAAGSEADSSGGTALEVGSDDEAGSSLSDGATCDRFPDDKNGSAVEVIAGDGAAGFGGKECRTLKRLDLYLTMKFLSFPSSLIFKKIKPLWCS